MAPGAAMECCDEIKADDQAPEPAPAPAPAPAPQAPQGDAPHTGHTPG
jgi:hypothetical protein